MNLDASSFLIPSILIAFYFIFIQQETLMKMCNKLQNDKMLNVRGVFKLSEENQDNNKNCFYF